MNQKSVRRIVVVSPHRDDAAFSCGILLSLALNSVAVTIVNIFTRSAYAPFAEGIEKEGVESVTALRRREDAAMMESLRTVCGAASHLTEVDLSLFDGPLRLKLDTEDVLGEPLEAIAYEREVAILTRVLTPHLMEADCILLPMGLGGRGLQGHIDHQIARDAGLRCAPRRAVAFYEDLPYAARMRAEDRIAAAAVLSVSVDNEPARPLTIEKINASSTKAALVRFYASQVDVDTMNEMCAYAGEQGGELVYASDSAERMLLQL